MRRAGSARLLALALLVAGARAHAETPIPPAPTRWVTDKAAFLSPAVADELDGRLGRYDADTGHQVLVYIDRTTDGVPIEDWAVKAFAAWRVGRKGIDDGLVLFIFKDDHRLRIEVGYGLEDRVPDVVASRIVNDVMVPRIRAGDDDGAVRGGVDAIVAAIGAGPGGQPSAKIPLWQIVGAGIFLLVILVFAVTHPALAWLLLLNIGSGRRGGGWGRGGGGFGGGGFGGGGFSGGGGRSGGGGASGSW